MRFRNHEEATAFVKALLNAKVNDDMRELMTAKLDTVPAWSDVPKDPEAPEWEPDGSRVTAVYMAFRKPTSHQKTAAEGAKLAGVSLQLIEGRLVDVRTCKDGTVQLLLTNGLRNEAGKVPFRGPNVDKGILCALSIDEGLGESVDEIIARVPQEMKDRLQQMKDGTYRAPAVEVDLEAAAAANVPVPATGGSEQAPVQDNEPDEIRHRLK